MFPKRSDTSILSLPLLANDPEALPVAIVSGWHRIPIHEESFRIHILTRMVTETRDGPFKHEVVLSLQGKLTDQYAAHWIRREYNSSFEIAWTASIPVSVYAYRLLYICL